MKKTYKAPLVRTIVKVSAMATTLLAGSIVNNLTSTTSEGQYIDHVYSWDDSTNPFNHTWE